MTEFCLDDTHATIGAYQKEDIEQMASEKFGKEVHLEDLSLAFFLKEQWCYFYLDGKVSSKKFWASDDYKGPHVFIDDIGIWNLPDLQEISYFSLLNIDLSLLKDWVIFSDQDHGVLIDRKNLSDIVCGNLTLDEQK